MTVLNSTPSSASVARTTSASNETGVVFPQVSPTPSATAVTPLPSNPRNAATPAKSATATASSMTTSSTVASTAASSLAEKLTATSSTAALGSTQVTSSADQSATQSTSPTANLVATEQTTAAPGQSETSSARVNAKTPIPDSASSSKLFGSWLLLMKESNIPDFVEKYENIHTSAWGDKERCMNLFQFAARAEERMVVEALVMKHGHNWAAVKDELKTLKPQDFVITPTVALERLRTLKKDKLDTKQLLSDLLLLKTCLECAKIFGHNAYVGALIACLPEELLGKETEGKLSATKTRLDAERVVLSAALYHYPEKKAAASGVQNPCTRQLDQPALTGNIKKATDATKKNTRGHKERGSRLFNKPFQPATPSPQFYIPQFRGWIEGRRTTMNIELDSSVNLMSMSAFKSIPGLVLSLMDTSLEITGFFAGHHRISHNTAISQPTAPLNVSASTPVSAKKDATIAPTNTYSAPDHDSEDESDKDDDKKDEGEGEHKEEQEEQVHQAPQTSDMQTLQVEGICKHALIKFGDLEQEGHIFVVADHPVISNTGIILGMPFLQDAQSRVLADSTGDYWLMLHQNGASVALRFIHDN